MKLKEVICYFVKEEGICLDVNSVAPELGVATVWEKQHSYLLLQFVWVKVITSIFLQLYAWIYMKCILVCTVRLG